MAATVADDRNRTVVLVHPCATSRRSVQPSCDMPLELIAVGSPVAGFRMRHRLYHAPIGIAAARTLGLYGYAD